MNKFSCLSDLRKSGANLVIFLHIIVNKSRFLILSFAGLTQKRSKYAGYAVLFGFADLDSGMFGRRMTDRKICHILQDELRVHIVIIVFTDLDEYARHLAEEYLRGVFFLI